MCLFDSGERQMNSAAIQKVQQVTSLWKKMSADVDGDMTDDGDEAIVEDVVAELIKNVQKKENKTAKEPSHQKRRHERVIWKQH